jgi:peroxiredoxin
LKRPNDKLVVFNGRAKTTEKRKIKLVDLKKRQKILVDTYFFEQNFTEVITKQSFHFDKQFFFIAD